VRTAHATERGDSSRCWLVEGDAAALPDDANGESMRECSQKVEVDVPPAMVSDRGELMSLCALAAVPVIQSPQGEEPHAKRFTKET